MNLKIQSTVMVLSFLAYLKFGFAIEDKVKKQLLNDGRLKVAECIQSYISSDSPDSIFKKNDWIEVFYRKFCHSKSDTKEGKRRNDLLEDENAETNVKQCLQEENVLPLFDNYKNEYGGNSKNQEKPQHEGTVSEFTKFIKGFCILPETVKFEFDEPDNFLKIKVVNCLKNCATHLFKFVEERIAELSKSKIIAKREAEKFDSECVNEGADDIGKLTNIGEEWLSEYDKALQEAYKVRKIPEIKDRLTEDFNTYTTCAHFVCLMSEKDTPFYGWLQEENEKMHIQIIITP